MAEQDELRAEVAELRSALDTLRADFEAHKKDHVPTQRETQTRARQQAI
jgi:outer membrane murein-binding lipoprotein Lpp